MRGAESGLPFSEIIRRVAEGSGYVAYSPSTGLAIAPTDANRLDRVKREINDAAREFSRAVDPDTGRGVVWTWMSESIEIDLNTDGSGPLNVNADARRYALPQQIAAHCKRARWKTDTYGGRGVSVVHADMVRAHWNRYPTATGAPLYVAVVPSPDTQRAGASMPLEMIVAPTPSEAFTISATFGVRLDPLVQDGDRGVWPEEHDLTIVRWAVANLKVGDASWPTHEARRENALRDSIAADQRLKPDIIARQRRNEPLPMPTVHVEYNGTIIL